MAENTTVQQNDDQVLLTPKDMADKKKESYNKFLYFEDGVRKIDCIIAYNVSVDDDKASAKEANRDIYVANLEKRGLQCEVADSAKVSSHSRKCPKLNHKQK